MSSIKTSCKSVGRASRCAVSLASGGDHKHQPHRIAFGLRKTGLAFFLPVQRVILQNLIFQNFFVPFPFFWNIIAFFAANFKSFSHSPASNSPCSKRIEIISKKCLTKTWCACIIKTVADAKRSAREHSSAGRAHALQAWGHRFEPCCSHHFIHLARWCSRLARQPVTLEVDGSSPFRVAIYNAFAFEEEFLPHMPL